MGLAARSSHCIAPTSAYACVIDHHSLPPWINHQLRVFHSYYDGLALSFIPTCQRR